jgi:predicted DCC family thiol-disulfide oxidoreductase YuxK
LAASELLGYGLRPNPTYNYNYNTYKASRVNRKALSKRDRFRFVPLQSDLAHTMLRRYGLSTHDFDTVVVVADFDGGSARVLTRADAVLWCVRQLGGVARLFAVVGVFLPCMREAAYRLIARCRYRIFGKSDTCPLPNPRDRHKFLA